VNGILLSKARDGKFVESWSSWDTMTLLQQLGVMPSKETVAA
jgi:predicted ester cyclase